MSSPTLLLKVFIALYRLRFSGTHDLRFGHPRWRCLGRSCPRNSHQALQSSPEGRRDLHQLHRLHLRLDPRSPPQGQVGQPSPVGKVLPLPGSCNNRGCRKRRDDKGLVDLRVGNKQRPQIILLEHFGFHQGRQQEIGEETRSVIHSILYIITSSLTLFSSYFS